MKKDFFVNRNGSDELKQVLDVAAALKSTASKHLNQIFNGGCRLPHCSPVPALMLRANLVTVES